MSFLLMLRYKFKHIRAIVIKESVGCFTGWITVPSMSARLENNEVIPFDMNSGNLQIKTESTAKNNDKMRVHLYDKTGYIIITITDT